MVLWQAKFHCRARSSCGGSQPLLERIVANEYADGGITRMASRRHKAPGTSAQQQESS